MSCAFRLALAEPNPSDRPATKQEKAILRETWGDWPEAKNRLPRSHARSLVTYLVDHPTDFRGAFARLKRELRSLYFSAYQSYLWNLMLGRLIEDTTRPDQRVPIDFKVATLPLQRSLDPDQARVLAACAFRCRPHEPICPRKAPNATWPGRCLIRWGFPGRISR